MNVAILGATGSIGRNALDLAAAFPGRLRITAMSCASQVRVMAEAVRVHRPRLVAVAGPGERRELLALLSGLGVGEPPEIVCGAEGCAAVAAESEAEVVLSAIVGLAGLPPTLAAVERGRKVALANKESLVAGGELLLPLARRTGAEIIPVDSEHSALFQLLGGLSCSGEVRRLILTASGGPFRGRPAAALEKVTREEALAHPRWSMGPQVTCDSATMMNKGLELIEAHHLFGLPYDRLDVLVHPQSVVHALVEYVDGTQSAVLSPPDMRLAIAYALSHPRRWPLLPGSSGPGLAGFSPLDLPGLSGDRGGPGNLSFELPDHETFPALRLAEAAGREGGTAPAVLLGANEEAVRLFLDGRIGFLDIPRLVSQTLEALPAEPLADLAQIRAVSVEARRLAGSLALKFAGRRPVF
ncbi:MAG: 1-deoxy-D-xylulose-5-phosphate reductoisomerase [Candidatus Adiutrix sp.]|jgi:1-deoxy-D-xylulose-5-phosphate reductoisomerase|nr:1-deoxy-D-xylulose-5-phosphate reductoisomerase [Candidatus Adiutrix sp.]